MIYEYQCLKCGKWGRIMANTTCLHNLRAIARDQHRNKTDCNPDEPYLRIINPKPPKGKP